MDQIKKRLEIIKIAIFLADEETIKLQLLKLEYFPDNEKLEYIIQLLKKKGYGQAQEQINKYLKIDDDFEVQHEQNDEYEEQWEDDSSSIIEEFELLKPAIQRHKEAGTYVTPNSTVNKSKKIVTSYNALPHKEFQLTSEEIDKIPAKKNSNTQASTEQESLTNEEQEPVEFHVTNSNDNKNIKEINEKYSPLPDILERFQELLFEQKGRCEYRLEKSVMSWINRIKSNGYKDSEILAMSKYLQNLKQNGKLEEASQIAYVCGATESNLGKLIFARELFKGDIFTQDIQKAFRITKALALKNHPDAICDLGQYCEHGQGTKKSIEHALHFYKRANDMGLERAGLLYEHLKNKKGFFSFLFKSED